MKIKKLLSLSILLLLSGFIFCTNEPSYEQYYQANNIGIRNLKYFEKAYPNVKFQKRYISKKRDWLVTIDVNGTKSEFYWANGSMLPEEELKNKDKYWSILSFYPKEIPDPKNYSPEEIHAIREYGSAKARSQGKGTPMFFFDAVYDTHDQESTEKHIARLPFINRWVNVHEILEEPLNRVTEKMYKAAETMEEVQEFIDSIKVYEVYSWREIQGTGRKSFHGLGIAIDALPKNLGKKQIFWSWTKNYNPENWMLTPLSQRWMPPESVIKIFESEGFAWGGKWAIFDNMHFEYRPELLLFNKIIK